MSATESCSKTPFISMKLKNLNRKNSLGSKKFKSFLSLSTEDSMASMSFSDRLTMGASGNSSLKSTTSSAVSSLTLMRWVGLSDLMTTP